MQGCRNEDRDLNICHMLALHRNTSTLLTSHMGHGASFAFTLAHVR